MSRYSRIACLLLLLFLARYVHATSNVPGTAFARFITIWLENEDFTPVTENADFAYLAQSGISLTSYYALTHPSQPNYIASIAGEYFGLDSDDDVELPANVSTVVDLLDSKNISWKAYMEDIPSPGFTGTSSGSHGYVRKHNPFVTFDSITQNSSRSQNLVSFDVFNSDLASEKLPQYAFMSPNLTDDGHDSGLATGLSWARTFLSSHLSNPYFKNRTLILLTFDENANHADPNKIGSLLLGDIPTSLQGTNDSTFYTHYSTLATLENNFGLPDLGRYDVGANVFEFVANLTGWKNQDSVDVATVKLEGSYPGYLNSQSHGLLPLPNIHLNGSGGVGVLAQVVNQVVNETGDGTYDTPYNGSGGVFDNDDPPVYGTVQRLGRGDNWNATGTAPGANGPQQGAAQRQADMASACVVFSILALATLVILS